MPTPPLEKQIAKLIRAAPGAEDVRLEATGWLYDTPPRKFRAIYQEFKRKFQPRKAELVDLFGKPTWSLLADRAWFDRWFPESGQADAWAQGEKVICLAVAHEDRETPVCLLLRCVTLKEIDELSA